MAAGVTAGDAAPDRLAVLVGRMAPMPPPRPFRPFRPDEPLGVPAGLGLAPTLPNVPSPPIPPRPELAPAPFGYDGVGAIGVLVRE